MSCEEIARERQRTLDCLVAQARDVPECHRSLQAVFDHSWRLLSPGEQDALRREFTLDVLVSGLLSEARAVARWAEPGNAE